MGTIFVGAALVVAVGVLAYVIWRIGSVNALILAALRDEVKVLNEHLNIQPLAAWTDWLKAEVKKQARRRDRSSPMI